MPLDNLPVLFAARYPGTDRWFVDTDEALVRRVAGAISPPAEVVRVDWAGLERVRAAAELVRAAIEDESDCRVEVRRVQGLMPTPHNQDRLKERQEMLCRAGDTLDVAWDTLDAALAALEKEVPDAQKDR